MKRLLIASLVVAAAGSRARAGGADDIDVRAFEYIDVLETGDGHVWKGVIVEQIPGVSYKIASADGTSQIILAPDVTKIKKEKNRDYQPPVAVAVAPPAPAAAPPPNAVGATYDRDNGLPPPLATSGLRLEALGLLAFPSGDFGKTVDTSYGATIAVGYEALLGNFGLGGGGMARFSTWQLPQGQLQLYTIETMAYGRAALHLGRVALYGGIALGADTNYAVNGPFTTGNSQTRVGFGMNVQSGVEIAPNPSVMFKLGFDYHPGTDKTSNGLATNIEYAAVQLGVGLRL